jgi:nucleoside-diphosphate-sugar epimerase
MRTKFFSTQWIDMKVLVTGATSGLGRNAVEFLRNKGISVRATGRNEAMGKLLQKMGAEFVHADLTELVSSQAKVMLAGIDTLWHCSSFTSPWGTQEAFDLANVRATRRLGEWAVAWGVRNFIHISSPSLYFDYHHHRDIQEDFRPARFACEFARSKAASEEVIDLLAQSNPHTVLPSASAKPVRAARQSVYSAPGADDAPLRQRAAAARRRCAGGYDLLRKRRSRHVAGKPAGLR